MQDGSERQCVLQRSPGLAQALSGLITVYHLPLPNPASFSPLLQALVPRVFLHTKWHLGVCLLGTHLATAGRDQSQG